MVRRGLPVVLVSMALWAANGPVPGGATAFADPGGGGLPFFQEDFSGDLSAWNLHHAWTPYTIEIVGSDGNPPAALLLDDQLNFGCYATSKQAFHYVGTGIDFAADIKVGNAAFADQRFASVWIAKSSTNREAIAELVITGSSHPTPNKAMCRFNYGTDPGEPWESSALLPIPSGNGDGWHHAVLRVRPDGLLECHLDGQWLYTGANPLTPAYDGVAAVMVGGRRSLYDNVTVVNTAAPSQGFCWEKRATPLAEGYPGILVHDGKLWTFGGETVAPTNPWNAVWSDAIRSYDPDSDVWTRKGASLPYACVPSAGTLTALGDKMYMSPQIGPALNNGWGTHHGVIEYDFMNDAASETATYCEYPSIWTSMMQASLTGHVYSFGGWNGGSVQSIYRHDGAGCLTLLPETLPQDGRLVASCRDAAGRFVIYGNYAGPLRVDIFDPTTDSFLFSGDIMPHDLEWASVAWLDRDGSLYLGKGWPDGVPSPSVYRFDPDAHTFTRAPFDLPVESPGAGIYRSAYDPSSGKLYLIESFWNGSSYETSLWIGTPGGCVQPDCDGNGIPDEQKLTAPDAAANDWFGTAVSVSGNTAVVTAYFADCAAGSDCGAAYVYTRSGSAWTMVQKLLASDAAANTNFGYSVAIDDDTIVVGAAGDDSVAGFDSGSAYVFVRSGGVWVQQQKLTSSDPAVQDELGGAVSVDGDTIVVGAARKNNVGFLSGSAYVFVRSGGVWTQQQKLVASDAGPLDRFGNSVSVSGDTVVVGAWTDSWGGFDTGSAYVFDRTGATWTQQQKLTASDAAVGDRFGISVSVNGDTTVVGADQDDDAGANSGSAYVFVRSGLVWTQQQRLTASDAAADDHLGAFVSVSGDTAVVAAYADDCAAGGDCGGAYVFARSGAMWTEWRKLTASDAAAADIFGISVSLSGNTAVVAAPWDDCAAGGDCGSAYVYEGVLGCSFPDCDGNGVPDDQQPDCDDDGTPDVCELNPRFFDDFAAPGSGEWTHHGTNAVNIGQTIPGAVYAHGAVDSSPPARITHVMPSGTGDFEAQMDIRRLAYNGSGSLWIGWVNVDDHAAVGSSYGWETHDSLGNPASGLFVQLNSGSGAGGAPHRSHLAVSTGGTVTAYEAFDPGPMGDNVWHTLKFGRMGMQGYVELRNRTTNALVAGALVPFDDVRNYGYFHISSIDGQSNNWWIDVEIDNLTLAASGAADCNDNGVPDSCEFVPSHGWVLNPSNGHHYRLTSASGSWAAAEDEAVADGGHLVAINDAAEQAWLVSTWPLATNPNLWIGLHLVGGAWVWTTGEPLAYTNWLPGEPSGDGSVAEMNHFEGFDGQWNDEHTSNEFGIIERAFPLPADCNGNGVPDECEGFVCDDGNPCTDDTCAGTVCVFTPNANPCEDGSACTVGDICIDGACAAGAPRDCDDGVDCTRDVCDAASGECISTPDDSLCDDARYCTGTERCDRFLGCQAGTPPSCDDGVECTIDLCDTATDTCRSTPDDSRCDDGLFCTGVEACDAMSGCRSGSPPDCDDGVDCTVDSCDEAADACVHDLRDADSDGVCDDGDECPHSDRTPTIVIGGCNTGVGNLLLGDGCTMSDEIAGCAAGARNHGAFVSCVALLTNEWKRLGRITGAEKGRIQSCAARADIPPRG